MEEMTIKNEFGHNYIVIQNNTPKADEYLLQMMLCNKIPGLLQCRQSYVDNKSYLYYDISNKKTLASEYENKQLSFQDICDLFIRINNILEQSHYYLIDTNYYNMNAQSIFIDMESLEFYLLYIPFHLEIENSSENRYYKLADFLLEKVCHRDEHAVNIAYQFYKMSKEEYFAISLFINYIEKEIKIKNHEGSDVKEEVKLESSQIEVEELFNTPDISPKNSWIMVILTGAIGCIFLALYFLIRGITIYAVFSFILGGISLLFSIIKCIINVIFILKHRKEDEIEMPLEPITVEEYWNDNNETIYFEEIADETPLEPVLEWKEKGLKRRYIMSEFPFVIGKMNTEADCTVDDSSVSRLHARITKFDGAMWIQDLGSRNGTRLNQILLSSGENLKIVKGDQLQLGKVTFNIV